MQLFYFFHFQELFKELCRFAKNIGKADFCLVTFMGHGCGDKDRVYLKTKDGMFEIYSNCSLIFNSPYLLKVPKMFIAQICRSNLTFATFPVKYNIK